MEREGTRCHQLPLGERFTNYTPRLSSHKRAHVEAGKLSGKVTGKREEGGEKLIDLEVKCTNQNGQDTLQGDATIALN